MKKCKVCAESIQDEAIKCRFCGESCSGDSVSGPNGATKIVELKKPIPLLGMRFLGQLVAVFMLFGAIALCFTLIGIPMGIGLGAMAVALNAASKGIRLFHCPYCKKKIEAVYPSENVKCIKCKNLVLVNWGKHGSEGSQRRAA